MTKPLILPAILFSWLCVFLPIVESFAFLHRNAPLQTFFGLHGGTALALLLTAFIDWQTRQVDASAHPYLSFIHVGLLVLACVDVAMQWVQGSDYLLSSMLQPFHILAVGMLAWRIVAIARRFAPEFGSPILVVGAPLMLLWGVAATWSPLVAVYADQYGGGDTLVSHGATCLLVFVATLVLTVLRASREGISPSSLAALCVIFGVSQALVADAWRFVPLLVGTGLTCAILTARWPHAHRLVPIVSALVWLFGYFATLRYTTMIAWDLTTWLGVCILGIILAAILATVSFKPNEVTT